MPRPSHAAVIASSLVLWLALAVLASCNHATTTDSGWNDELRAGVNRWTVTSLQDMQAGGAIVRRRTLYGHHFRPGSPELNERGHHHLEVLLGHYAEITSGTLIMPRGNADKPLYDARVETIRARLARAGVPSDRVAIVDAVPTGEGVPAYEMHGNQDEN